MSTRTSKSLIIPNATQYPSEYDTILSCLPSELVTNQTHLVDLAIRAKVYRFFPSDYGADWWHGGIEHAQYYVDKVKVWRYIQSKEDQISWTSMMVGPFADFYVDGPYYGEKTMLGFRHDQRKVNFVGDGTAKIGFTSLRKYVSWKDV